MISKFDFKVFVRLSCGCRRGYFARPESLWRRVAALGRRLPRGLEELVLVEGDSDEN